MSRIKEIEEKIKIAEGKLNEAKKTLEEAENILYNVSGDISEIKHDIKTLKFEISENILSKNDNVETQKSLVALKEILSNFIAEAKVVSQKCEVLYEKYSAIEKECNGLKEELEKEIGKDKTGESAERVET